MTSSLPAFDFSPYRLSGVVYGTLLNHRPALLALGDAVNHAPYKAPPKAPVLYVKPRNTLTGTGSAVPVPTDTPELQIDAALGIVIGRTASALTLANAMDHVAGYTVINDVSVPHDNFYRPSVRFKARDSSCVIGPAVMPASAVANPDALAVKVWVDGALVHETTTSDRIRDVAQLLVDVTDFMTLQPGDVLMLGASAGAPRVKAGQEVAIEIEGVGRLENRFVAEARPAPPTLAQAQVVASSPVQPTARVAYAGAVHSGTPHGPGQLRLADGRVVAEEAVTWLPPFEVGTIIALGLNYADHLKELSKELTVTSKDEPLVFLKGPGSVIGHRGQTRRPADVTFMHYECELAVVIGQTARNVKAADAMAHVAGYTVCNDYAIRDYLENYYRPNLRVKNRDGGTVLGPWFVPASAVPNPHNLRLRTLVNDQVRQDGTTANMVNDIPALIEYLSSFMTLQAGDVILTGTPEGVVNVHAGDEVVTEIEGIGRLVNILVGDDTFGR